MSNIGRHIELFFIGVGFIAVAAINTWQLAHQRVLDSLIFGFLSALIWSLIIKKIVFAAWVDRIIYAVGAAVGGVIGLYLVKMFYG